MVVIVAQAATSAQDQTALCAAVATALQARGWMMATAESCTGGMIAAACTDLSGSSNWFERGFVTYSNQAKNQMLGVDAALIERDGAVSETVAHAMVLGALRHAPVQAAVAVTGVAGPTGGSPIKPVGTVWFGWNIDGAIHTEMRRFDGDRAAVRRATVTHALARLLEMLHAHGDPATP